MIRIVVAELRQGCRERLATISRQLPDALRRDVLVLQSFQRLLHSGRIGRVFRNGFAHDDEVGRRGDANTI